MPEFKKWFKTKKLSDALSHAVKGRLSLPLVWKPKVKLHGTNAGLHYRNGEVVAAQSRNRMLSLDGDNQGFRASFFIESGKAKSKHPGFNGLIMGEWAGPGVQSGVAVNKIPRKMLFVFGVWDADAQRFIDDPEEIATIVPDHPDVHVIPWAKLQDGSDSVRMIYDNPRAFQYGKLIENTVDAIDSEDPYIKEKFGISGVGEGLVFFPQDVSFEDFGGLLFKFKGNSHKQAGEKQVKDKAKAALTPEQYASIEELVKREVNDYRCNQGLLEACGGELSNKGIGLFIRWMIKDVQEETVNEREASGIPWKYCGSSVATAARVWYLNKMNNAD